MSSLLLLGCGNKNALMNKHLFVDLLKSREYGKMNHAFSKNRRFFSSSFLFKTSENMLINEKRNGLLGNKNVVRMFTSTLNDNNKEKKNQQKVIPSIKRKELKKTLTHRFSVPFNANLFEKLNLSLFSVGELTKAFEKLDLDKDGVLNTNDILASFGDEMGYQFIEHYSPSSSCVEVSLAHFVNHTTKLAEKIDARVWPIAGSMFLTGLFSVLFFLKKKKQGLIYNNNKGTAVGIVVPVLPMFVQQTLSGNGTEFGMGK